MVNYDASDVPIIQPNTSSTIKVNKNKTTLLLFNVTSIIESSIYYRMIYNISDFDLISNLNIFIYTSDQKADDFVEFSDNIQPSAKFTCSYSFTFDNGTTICYSSYKQSSFPTRMFYIIPESNSTTDKQIEFYATDIKEYATFGYFTPKVNTSAPLNKINYLESQLKLYDIPNTYYVQIILPSEFKVIHFYHKYKETKYKTCGPYKGKEKDNNLATFYFGPINRTEEQTDVEFLLDVLTTNITKDTKFYVYIIDKDEGPQNIIQKNSENYVYKDKNTENIFFFFKLTDYENDEEIYLEVKMDNLHFKSEDIFYLFDTEDCLNIDISQKVIINKASVGRNLTIDKEKLNA